MQYFLNLLKEHIEDTFYAYFVFITAVVVSDPEEASWISEEKERLIGKVIHCEKLQAILGR